VLKFIYNIEYDKSAIEAMAGNDKIKRILIPMGIYTIADKYAITRLYSSAFADFAATLHSISDHDYKTLRAVIMAHYGSETGCSADTLMGSLITSFLLEHRRDFLNFGDFETLISTFPWFAVDVVLKSKHQGVFHMRKASSPKCGHQMWVDTSDKDSFYSTVYAPCISCGQRRDFK
jgi:hypothetical protein